MDHWQGSFVDGILKTIRTELPDLFCFNVLKKWLITDKWKLQNDDLKIRSIWHISVFLVDIYWSQHITVQYVVSHGGASTLSVAGWRNECFTFQGKKSDLICSHKSWVVLPQLINHGKVDWQSYVLSAARVVSNCCCLSCLPACPTQLSFFLFSTVFTSFRVLEVFSNTSKYPVSYTHLTLPTTPYV